MRKFAFTVALLALGWLAGGAAFAQSVPRSYAVISEVARQVSVVSAQPSIGSRLDSNQRQRIDVPDGALDKVFLLTTQAALKRLGPPSTVWLLAPADSDFFPPSNFSDGATVKMPEDLAAALKERQSTHLLLYTRHRAEPDLRFDNSTDGTGTFEGLGYYVDQLTRVRDTNTNLVAIGYLASFAHFRVTLIDVASSRVVRTMTTRANFITPVASAQGQSAHPWNTLTPAQKMAQLRDLVIKEVDRMLPELTKAQP